MKRCTSWRKYIGLRKPTCNNGKGCDSCNKVFKFNKKLK